MPFDERSTVDGVGFTLAVMKQKHFIDSHKGVTGLAVLAMMFGYDAWDNATAWLYLATHGGYGLMWVLKSASFGDKQWEQPCSLGYGAVIWMSLSVYWIAPWLIVARDLQARAWLMGTSVFLYAVGVFFHFASDMQKHVSLALKPGLITTGLWSRSRNPNYFGELLIYAGFSALAMHWGPFVVLATFVVAVWIPNMRKKDASLSRYPEFAAYKTRSGWMCPRLW